MKLDMAWLGLSEGLWIGSQVHDVEFLSYGTEII